VTPDPQEREVLRLAAIALALIPGGVEHCRAYHRPSPHGTCAGCGRPWRCRFGHLADAARALTEAATYLDLPGPARNASWDADPPDTVPPVLGLGDE
jgi:hypothetical protein